jgi:hypothetical protein
MLLYDLDCMIWNLYVYNQYTFAKEICMQQILVFLKGPALKLECFLNANFSLIM